MIGLQHFNNAVITKKKIINNDLCLINFEVENWHNHVPGQYSEICLTSENGYQAIRPYSIASSPDEESVTFLIERINNGEVSTFLYDVSTKGDKFQVSNPIGKRFILQNKKIPVFVASGSGIAPFISMSKYLANKNKKFYMYHWSKNLPGLVIYEENKKNINSFYFPSITREKPADWLGGDNRINSKTFNNLDLNEKYEFYVCGSDFFVENALKIISNIGKNNDIYTERFGSF
jgi:ferredoxin-NADP reductase